MTQADVFEFFRNHKGLYFSISQVADGAGISIDRASKACLILSRFGILKREAVHQRKANHPYLRYMMQK